jgi:hypothetical protein
MFVLPFMLTSRTLEKIYVVNDFAAILLREADAIATRIDGLLRRLYYANYYTVLL